MLTHAQVWDAIDTLAARHGMSASGLARKAGLDPTTFNRSKRQGHDGRLRWPSTELLAKILQATGASLDEFMGLLSTRGEGSRRVPLIGMAQAGDGGFFDDAGFPAGAGWDEIVFPNIADENAYALEISGDSMTARLSRRRRGDRLAQLARAARRPRRGQDARGRGARQGAQAPHRQDHRAALDQSRTSGPVVRRQRRAMDRAHPVGGAVSVSPRAAGDQYSPVHSSHSPRAT